MPTRVVTTNPAGHTVSKFDADLTAYQVADEYEQYYDAIDVWHIEDTIPDAWYIRCHKVGKDSILYQIKWDVLPRGYGAMQLLEIEVASGEKGI